MDPPLSGDDLVEGARGHSLKVVLDAQCSDHNIVRCLQRALTIPVDHPEIWVDHRPDEQLSGSRAIPGKAGIVSSPGNAVESIGTERIRVGLGRLLVATSRDVIV